MTRAAIHTLMPMSERTPRRLPDTPSRILRVPQLADRRGAALLEGPGLQAGGSSGLVDTMGCSVSACSATRGQGRGCSAWGSW